MQAERLARTPKLRRKTTETFELRLSWTEHKRGTGLAIGVSDERKYETARGNLQQCAEPVSEDVYGSISIVDVGEHSCGVAFSSRS